MAGAVAPSHFPRNFTIIFTLGRQLRRLNGGESLLGEHHRACLNQAKTRSSLMSSSLLLLTQGQVGWSMGGLHDWDLYNYCNCVVDQQCYTY